VNFHTERQDVEALLEIDGRFGRKLDQAASCIDELNDPCVRLLHVAVRFAAARSAKLLCVATRSVAWRITLDAPAFFERPHIHSIEPELIDQSGHRFFGILVVASNYQGPAIARPAG
jgi:hypothetical protein